MNTQALKSLSTSMLLDESAQNIRGFLVRFCSSEAGILFQALQFV